MPVMRSKGGKVNCMHIPRWAGELKSRIKMLKFFYAATLLLFAWSAQAQFSITGTVRGAQDHQTLAGATVQVLESKSSDVTNELGWFRLDKLQPGSYTLLIKFLGYED